MQWGYIARSGAGTASVTYPISLTTLYTIITSTKLKSQDSSMSGCGVYSYTTSKAVLYNGAGQSEAMAWLVVGK